MIDTLWQDLRFAIRLLVKSPGFAAVAVFTLALGIGANTAIFSVVDAVLLRPLPYKNSNRLVMLWATDQEQGLTRDVASYPDFTDWKDQSRSFEHVAAFAGRGFNLSGGERPEQVRGLRVSSELFATFAVSPVRGRDFLPEERMPGKDHVLLLSDNLWRRMGADPGPVGKALKLNDETYTIVGVLPAGFVFPPNETPAVYVPLVEDLDRGHGFLRVVARRKPGVKVADAQTEMDAIASRLRQQYPKTDRSVGVNVMSLQQALAGDMRAALLIFSGVVGFVLLIACANVANLLLGRTASRRREFALRAALGAKRPRVIQQLLTESTLMGLVGGALGLALSIWGVTLLLGLLHANFPDLVLPKVALDLRVLVFTLLLSFLTGLVFGLAPAVGAARPNLNEALQEGGRTLGGLHRSRVRNVLVVSEVALSLVLLIGAGLMVRSFLLLRGVNPGFHPENVLTADFALYEKKYSSPQVRTAFFQQVLERVKTLPSVQSAGLVSDIPLSGNDDSLSFHIEGVPDPATGRRRSAGFNGASPGYFATMGIPLMRGRDFTDADVRDTPGVVVINETSARRFWPNQDPIGRRIGLDGSPGNTTWFSIVGIVGDVHHLGLGSEPRPEFFFSYLQDPVGWPYLSMTIRTTAQRAQLASAIQAAVWSVDKDQPVSNIRTMEQILSVSIAQPRVYTFLLGTFAALALALAAVGIYGVVSYSVAQRTHEIGIRMALGAAPGSVLRLMVWQGVLPALFGIGLGVVGALGATQSLARVLYGVRPTDPVTFAAVALLLAAVAVAACYVPARRATRVAPMEALRYE